jgi:hypothetical protein
MIILHKQVTMTLLLVGIDLLSGDNMSTIEFEVQAKNGIIKIPDQYKELENAFLKIKIQQQTMKPGNNKKLIIKNLLERIIRKNVFKNITAQTNGRGT